MKPAQCECEAEVLAGPVGEPLRAHISCCEICREAARVADAIREARDELRSSARIPDSGRVWRQAQIRARREAIAAAGRPITAAQMIAFACATGLLGACFGATSPWFQAALQRIPVLLAGHVGLAIGMAALLLLVPAAAWFAVVGTDPHRTN
jgi:hypothetical protein